MSSVLVNFIKDNPNDWEEKLNNLKITVKRDGDLAIFNYSILADFHNPLVQEARGIIIDLAEMRVVCFPFRKFGNYGESYVDKIDWTTARVQQKVDGSIMKVWYWHNEWHISTNAVMDAGTASCGNYGLSFKDVFERAATNVGLDYSKLNKNKTYVFELVAPENRVVCDYNGVTTLYHTGTRDNITGLESIEDIGVQHPAEYPLHSLDECIAAAKALNKEGEVVTDEGYVIVDAEWNRVKVKSPLYVAIHHVLPNGEISDEKLISLIREGDLEEILTYIPSLESRVKKMEQKIEVINNEIFDYCYWNKKEVEDNKMSRGDWARCHNKDKFFNFGVKYVFDGVEPNICNLTTRKLCELVSKCL